MSSGMKIVNVYILHGLFLPLNFGIDMIRPLRSVDIYLWYGWLNMELFGEFALLFLVESPINGICKFFASEWEKSQQWSWIRNHLRVGKISSAERGTLVGLWVREIPLVERLRVGKIPHQRVSTARKLVLTLTSPNGENPISETCKLWLDCGENLNSGGRTPSRGNPIAEGSNYP